MEKPPVEQPEAEPPEEKPVEPPVEQPETDETKAVYQEVIPDCSTIVGDIKNGRIQQKNFMYLTNACNESIESALKIN